MLVLVNNSLFTETVSVKNGKIVSNERFLINNIGKKETRRIDDRFALSHPYIDFTNYFLNTWDIYYDIRSKIVLINNPVYNEINGIVKSSLSSKNIYNGYTYSINFIFVYNRGVQCRVYRLQ